MAPEQLTSSKLTILFGHGSADRSMLVFADRGRSSSSESEQTLKGMSLLSRNGCYRTGRFLPHHQRPLRVGEGKHSSRKNNTKAAQPHHNFTTETEPKQLCISLRAELAERTFGIKFIKASWKWKIFFSRSIFKLKSAPLDAFPLSIDFVICVHN